MIEKSRRLQLRRPHDLWRQKKSFLRSFTSLILWCSSSRTIQNRHRTSLSSSRKKSWTRISHLRKHWNERTQSQQSHSRRRRKHKHKWRHSKILSHPNKSKNQTLEQANTVLTQVTAAYKANSNYEDAIHSYQRLIKDHEYPTPYMIYLEIGNFYVLQQKYQDAVKNYNIGINYHKPDSNRLKACLKHACAVAQISMQQYHQAFSSFETAMILDPSIKTGFNLIICHSILSSTEDMWEVYSRQL